MRSDADLVRAYQRARPERSDRAATDAQVELSAGTVDYVDTGGDGPVLVLAHGLPMSPTQWRKVVPLLPGY